MKNSQKKGFTIVELVIVIAVIGILAAVLIPVFSNLTEQANLSADKVAVKNMNTALATSQILNENIESVADVRIALDQAGFNVKELNPTLKGYKFYWNKPTNTVMLVDCRDENQENWAVVYPENSALISDFANSTDRYARNFNIAELPNAKVERISPVITEDNVWDYGNNTEFPLTLDCALRFEALETLDEVQSTTYKDWFVDFKISLSENIDTLLSNGAVISLAGQYEGFSEDWVVLTVFGEDTGLNFTDIYLFDAMYMAAGIKLDYTYETVVEQVQVFNCGIAVDSNTDFSITLELQMFENKTDYDAKTNPHVISSFTYDIE